MALFDEAINNIDKEQSTGSASLDAVMAILAALPPHNMTGLHVCTRRMLVQVLGLDQVLEGSDDSRVPDLPEPVMLYAIVATSLSMLLAIIPEDESMAMEEMDVKHGIEILSTAFMQIERALREDVPHGLKSVPTSH